MSKRKRREETETQVASGESQPDKSPFIYQDSKLKTPVAIRCRYQLTEKQEIIRETAMDKQTKLVLIDGLWGTGKTLVATLAALQLINDKKVSGLVYLRNPLEATATAKVGTLPGTLEERMETYNAILYDKLGELLPAADIDRLKKEKRVECMPVGLIQGKTFACKAVILDEAASCSYDDIMLVVSRLGEHGKLFIIGDSQFQLTLGSRSGFKRFFDIFHDQESMDNGVFAFELKEKSDIRRSGLLRFVMEKTGVIKTRDQSETENEPMFPT